MRMWFAVLFAGVLAVLTAHAMTGQRLTPEPMRIEKVKDNLYVVRGPFNACAPNGCGANGVDDGLLHEAGDVAVRVTSQGVIDFDTVIPGHGRVLTKNDVRAYVPKFELMNKRMADLVKKHVPKDQLERQLKLDDLGWAHTVSTGTFMHSVGQYYDEVARAGS